MEEKKEIKKPGPKPDRVKVKVIWDKGGFVKKGEVGKTRPTIVEDNRGMYVGKEFHKCGSIFETTKKKAERWAAKGLVKIVT